MPVLCPLCHQPAKALLSRKNLNLWVCTACSVHFRSAAQQANHDHFLDLDFAAYENSVRKTREDSYKTLLKSVSEHTVQGKWLDVGCSFGWLLDAVYQQGYEAYGVDPSASATAALSTKPFKVETGLYPASDGGAAPYQVISFIDVLEHMENPVEILEKTHALLAPEGVLVIQLPDQASLMYQLSVLLARFHFSSSLDRLYLEGFDFPHLYYFNAHSLTLLLEKTGFKPVNVERIPLGRIQDTWARITYAGKGNPLATVPLVLGTSALIGIGTLTGYTGLLRVLAVKK